MWNLCFWCKEKGTKEEKQHIVDATTNVVINIDPKPDQSTQPSTHQSTTNSAPSRKTELSVMAIAAALTALIKVSLEEGLELNPIITGLVSGLSGAVINISLRKFICGITPTKSEAIIGGNNSVLVFAGGSGFGDIIKTLSGSELAGKIVSDVLGPLAQAGAVPNTVRQAPPKEKSSTSLKR